MSKNLPLIALVLAGLAAAAPARAEDKIIVGLVTKTEVNPYFVKLRQAALAEAQKQGATLIARAGKFDGDNEGQVAAIEDLISAGAKGILLTPSNSTGVLGAVKKARDKGILVIALDTATTPADAVDATIATDNFEAGEKQGAYARKALGDKAPKLAMIDSVAGASVSEMRHNGYLEGLRNRADRSGDRGQAVRGRRAGPGADGDGEPALRASRHQRRLHHQRALGRRRLRRDPRRGQAERRAAHLDRRRLPRRAIRQERAHRGDRDAVPEGDGDAGRR